MREPPIDPQDELGLRPDQLPRHIAIIMDGNGRWANLRNRPRIHGHIEGAANVREIITHCARLKLDALTLYSFSAENWKRPRREVDALMNLYVEYLIKEREEIMDNDVRLIQIGRRDRLPEAVLRELDVTQNMSRNNRGLKLCLAINYGSRDEIVDAVRAIVADAQAGRLDPAEIDEACISSHLYTAGVPDPDLLVRTAGEMRVSNFLLWQISYAELYVTDVLWPDFGKDELNDAIRAYAARDRRFGGVKTDVPSGEQA
ncbi:MAG TPA: isoprenyl transferase [Phycisphaerae bacterium]|nr:isoprenyl transferase [Phycisphaerae bacterium]HSA27800.1 isoprenyl transferase [Phycisphaerae bacterium]